MSRNASAKSNLAVWVTLTIATVLVGVVCLWGLAANRLQFPETMSSGRDASASARRYLLKRPFDPAGWLAWSEGIGATGSAISANAKPAVAAAAILAPVDPQVLRAQASLALRQGEITVGLERAADLAVMFPLQRSDAFATLMTYRGDAAWLPFLRSRLKSKWPAIDAFLLESCRAGSSLRDLLDVTQQIVSKQPLAEETVTCIGNKAIAEGQVPAAYWLWLNASPGLPAAIGNVFNGDFELPQAGRLFDWRLGAGGEYREGFTIAVRSDNSRGMPSNVLAIRFNGRAIRSAIAQQFLALAPGHYTLTYSLRPEGRVTLNMVAWAVHCVTPSQNVTKSVEMGVAQRQPGVEGWSTHRQTLDIPAGCDGQILDLDVGSKLQMMQGLQGSVLLDDINIVRQ